MSNGYWSGASSPEQGEPSSDHLKTDPSVPAGFYVGEVIDFGAWPNEAEGYWRVKFSMRIIEGAQKGKYLVRWSNMEAQNKNRNFELFMNTLGELPAYDPGHGFAEYDHLRRRIQGAVVKIKAEPWKTAKSSGMNVYINQLVSAGEQVVGDPTPAPPADNDNIPF